MASFRDNRLFSKQKSADDSQVSMLSIISLLLLLLPFLLLTTSPQKLAALSFRLPEAGEGLPPLPKGIVEDLWVEAHETSLTLHKKLRNTDVGANQGQSTVSALQLEGSPSGFDLSGLQQALREIKIIDPNRVRVRLEPAPETTAAEIVSLMDAVRSDSDGALFEEVILTGSP